MDFTNYISSFIIGGTLCLVAQVLIDRTKLTPARILVGYVVAGVILSAVGIYDKLIEIGKAGATVPLTGFGHTLAEGVRNAVDKEGLIGALKGGISAASAGITAAIIFGFSTALVFKSRMK
ncbi:MAG: stage V sporulation protein AE [Ruminococcaceae bacterium]|nr:stage V sporulation protein AE [Oscillospiraceae bacterium]